MLSEWLAPVPGNPLRARCRVCHASVHAKLNGLLQHAKTSKHVFNMKQQAQRRTEQQQPDIAFGCVAFFSQR